MCLFELWFSQDICPVVGLLGHMVILENIVLILSTGTLHGVTSIDPIEKFRLFL